MIKKEVVIVLCIMAVAVPPIVKLLLGQYNGLSGDALNTAALNDALAIPSLVLVAFIAAENFVYAAIAFIFSDNATLAIALGNVSGLGIQALQFLQANTASLRIVHFVNSFVFYIGSIIVYLFDSIITALGGQTSNLGLGIWEIKEYEIMWRLSYG